MDAALTTECDTYAKVCGINAHICFCCTNTSNYFGQLAVNQCVMICFQVHNFHWKKQSKIFRNIDFKTKPSCSKTRKPLKDFFLKWTYSKKRIWVQRKIRSITICVNKDFAFIFRQANYLCRRFTLISDKRDKQCGCTVKISSKKQSNNFDAVIHVFPIGASRRPGASFWHCKGVASLIPT